MAAKKKQSSKRRVASKKSTGRPRARARVADAAAAEPPKYLVVFKKKLPQTQKVQALANTLGTTNTTTFAGLSKQSLSKAGANKPSAEVYKNFGVAAANLTKSECAALQARDQEVACVVKNEKRSIPRDPDLAGPSALGSTGGPILPFGSTAGPLLPFGRTAGPVLPFGGTAGPLLPFGGAAGPLLPFTAAANPLLDYLRGYRDGLAGLVAQLERASLPASAAAALQAASIRFTYGLTLIGLARESLVATGEGVKVAVLDTGVDTDHPDLQGLAADGANIRSFVPSEPTIEDVDGHGTHVAGTIASQLDASPRYGVAPNCTLLVGKVLNKDGEGYDSWILDAIDWALDNGARVINMSLGSPRGSGDPYSEAYEEIATAYLDSNTGPLLVAAAGNESDRQFGYTAPVGNPAACPSVLSVAAIDEAGAVSWFSSGQVDEIGRVDIAGPGSNVYSSIPGGKYGNKSGTSMAAPHISGLAALYLQRDPGLTPREVRDILMKRAKSLRLPSADVGAGLAQAPRATK